MRSKRILTLPVAALLVWTGACAKRAPAPTPAAGIAASPDASSSPAVDVAPTAGELFSEGLAAFREFTPEGYRRSIDLFSRASLLAPENCNYALHRAQANLLLAMEQESNLEYFQPALAAAAVPACDPGTAFGLRLKALLSFSDREARNAAVPVLEQALSLDPADPLTLWAFHRLAVPRRADEILKAAEIAPELALIQHELGQYWFERREFAEAKAAYERAIARSPRHFRSYIGLASATYSLDNDADIEPLLRRAVEIAPAYLAGRIVLGNYYAEAAEIQLAEQQYMEALRHKPDYEIAFLRLAYIYLQASRPRDADEAAQNALTINPGSYTAHYYLGEAWYARNDLALAQNAYEQALKLVFAYPEASYGLGTVFFDRGQYDLALEQFDKVIRYVPDHANAYLSRAMIFASRQHFMEAITDVDEALRYYNQELEAATTIIARAEARGLTRKATAWGIKKARLLELIQRATTLKSETESKQRNP